jgi:hypothetical protein
MTACTICGGEMGEGSSRSAYAEAGAWLSEELWHDAGALCPHCLESRARLAMMYLHEYNR